MKKSFLRMMALSSFFIGLNAQAMDFGKPISASIPVNNKQKHFTTNSLTSNAVALPLKKTVMLMNLKLTTQQKKTLLSQQPNKGQGPAAAQATPSTTNLPRQYFRGMNGTPVLDQGMHGTCVTFAVTAAVDAVLGKGDYISQLCSLQLGSYFEQKGYLPSGWDGTDGSFALNQIIGFGIINKTTQKTKACGGLNDYPVLNSQLVGSPMLLDEFKESSENLNEKIIWDPMLTLSQRLEWDEKSAKQANDLLNEVKKTIVTRKPYQDTRLTFATILPIDYCGVGACARFHADNDTWALTHAIVQDQNHNFASHQMIIIGYNDDAVAVDNEGYSHQGLLTLRNSWGVDAGDQGNYYMTYDFFKAFVIDIQKITAMKDKR